MQQTDHSALLQRLRLKSASVIDRALRWRSGKLSTMSLKTRVVVFVISMFIVGVWALAGGATLALERDLTRLLSTNFEAAAKGVADDLDRDIRLNVDALNRLAAFLTPEVRANQIAQAQAINQFSDASAITFSAYFVVDSNGVIVGSFPVHVVSVGTSVKDSDYFRRVMEGGKLAIGAPVATLKAPRDVRDVGVPIAVPLHSAAGTTVGALVGISDPKLLTQLEHHKLGETGWFLLVSPKERLILDATDRKRVLTSLPSHGVIPLMDRRLEEGFVGPGISKSMAGVEILSVGHLVATTGWVVIATDPTAEVFSPIADLKRWIYALAFLVSLVVALALRFFLHRQFAPLGEAGAAIQRMTEVSSWRAIEAIPVNRPDEIGNLIAGFNRLLAERRCLDAALHTEIDQHKVTNVALNESKERLAGIYNSVGEGILTIDSAQRVVLFNSAAVKIFGYAASDIMGQPLEVLLPQRYRLAHGSLVRGFAASGENSRVMGRYRLVYGRRANGEEFPVEATVSQSGVQPENLVTVILRDISERLQGEQERERLTEQLELLSERLSAAHEAERSKIAYELNEELAQELVTIKLHVQMLVPADTGSQTGTHFKDALAVVVRATERIRRLVMHLEPPELATFGLQAAVRSYCHAQAAVCGWILHIDAQNCNSRVPHAVERAGFHIMQEGLNNVLQHANASEVWIHVVQTDDRLELVIRDNGKGFDHTLIDERSQRAGANLGLFGMRRRVKQVGGTMVINSSVGTGTELRSVFPLTVEAALPV